MLWLGFSEYFFAAVQAQGNLVRLAHGARCRRMGGQVTRHADQHMPAGFGSASGPVLAESSVDYLEGMKTGVNAPAILGFVGILPALLCAPHDWRCANVQPVLLRILPLFLLCLGPE